jgi:hypothetical protein
MVGDAAARPAIVFGGVEVPALLAGGGIEREDLVVVVAGVEGVADLDRRAVEGRAVAEIDLPGHFELGDVLGRDPGEGRIAPAALVAAEMWPVLADNAVIAETGLLREVAEAGLVERIGRTFGDREEQHGAQRDRAERRGADEPRCAQGHAGGGRKAAGERLLRPRHGDPQPERHGDQEARQELPAVEPDLGDGPDDGEGQVSP